MNASAGCIKSINAEVVRSFIEMNPRSTKWYQIWDIKQLHLNDLALHTAKALVATA